MSLLEKRLSPNPRGAADPPCPNSSVSLPHHPQSPGWQGWALNFKRSFTSPFPNDKPLPLACSETGTKTILGAPMLPAPSLLSLSHTLPRPQWALSFSHAWHLTKLFPLGPFSCDIFPACLLLVNIIQGRQSFKVREMLAQAGASAHARTHTSTQRKERRRTSVEGQY